MGGDDLFAALEPEAPLADRMRPRCLDEVRGQDHLTAPDAPFRKLIESDRAPSMIFWGPPGSGKTTLARLVAGSTKSRFVAFSAVTSGVKEVREIVARAKGDRRMGQRTTLFIDEIHRFNRAQQDAFLPHVEDGTISLIGATTENPSFEVNAALLSRTQVFVLNLLDVPAICGILNAALDGDGHGLPGLRADTDALEAIATAAEGDARRALNVLETVSASLENGARVTAESVNAAMGVKALLYDKSGEEHYNLISALHKSLRDSDPHASLYWLARMLESGEHPHYILRRMVRFASEDIGNADPRALSIALAARDAYDFLGSPEGDLAIAHAAVYLATAPKSNSVYAAYGKAQKDVLEQPNLPVPMHLRNAPTGLMQDLGYGRGYQYAHDDPDGVVAQSHLPENLEGRVYYRPSDRGYEQRIRELMDWWDALRRRKSRMESAPDDV
ncbi:MAG: replication-associated recombination protein A [Candidatus Latescibacteria bacterium]|nr:replication-associated recombination protein A [Candidatus Latescibacterota bacterium]